MTFGTGATPYSCRIFPTRGRKVIDLACYMPLPNPAGITITSYPIVLSTDVVTKSTPKLTYGVETGMGFDFQTQQLLRMPFVDYLDNYPFEKTGYGQ